MPDVFSKETRSKIMSCIRGKDTKPELVVRRLLHRMGFRFRLHRKDLPGRPDIVLVKFRTAIFVNGCFWHGHTCRDGHIPESNTAYWAEKLNNNRERDKSQIDQLKKMGWNIITIWECETKDIDKLSKRIQEHFE